MIHQNLYKFMARNRHPYEVGQAVYFNHDYRTIVAITKGTGMVRLTGDPHHARRPAVRKWMNEALALASTKIRIELKKGEWYVVTPYMATPYVDGMELQGWHDEKEAFVN